MKTREVEVCGSPQLALRGDLAQFTVRLHAAPATAAGPDVHAEIHLYLHSSGAFWFERDWLLRT